MQHITLFPTLLCLLNIVNETETVTLYEASAVTCHQKPKVSAIVASSFDSQVAFLFSGKYVYQFRPKTKTLEQVDDIWNVFGNVTQKVEAALRPDLIEFYTLYSVDYVYMSTITTKMTERLTYEKYNRQVMRTSNIYIEQYPTCGATFCRSDDDCVFLLIYQTRKILGCTHKIGTGSPMNCLDQHQKIEYPDGSSPEGLILDQCEGILVKKNLTGNSEYGLIFADREKIYLWEGNKLSFELTYDELFECSSDLATIILIVFGVIAAVVLLGTVIIVLGSKYPRKRHSTPKEFRSGTKSSKTPHTIDRKSHSSSSQ